MSLITFTDPAALRSYRERLGTTIRLLTDADRSAYRAYGLGRGSVARVYGWRAARRYVEIIQAGGLRHLRRPAEDTLQLGGDFVVDADGTLSWGYWGEGPDDRPSVDRIIEAVVHAGGSVTQREDAPGGDDRA